MKIYIPTDSNSNYLKTQLINCKIIENENQIKYFELESNNLGKTVKKIGEKIKDDDIIFINCELKSNSKKRCDFLGIEILKWLRIKGLNNYCILYSFMCIPQIVKFNPLNSIMLSKGSRFIQLPFDELELKQCFNCCELAVKENLLPFFRSEVDLSKIRHELANTWGVIRMNSLLGIGGSPNASYFIELLKFISPINNNIETNRVELINLIDNFNSNGKKIIYYDDMVEIWKPVLQHIFKNNIICRDPKNTTKEDLFEVINNSNPGCLLLDLRLNNEKEFKDVLDYSGGKLLIEIKQKFSTLPVVMFTATNKAETLRQLISAGAEYVWTKEGIDDGINDKLTLNNTINLINEVSKCMNKFKNQFYEMIYKAECELKKITIEDNNLLRQLNGYEKLNIYFDTNYLINSIEEGYLSKFYLLLLTLNRKNQGNKGDIQVIIHSDVISEIFTISKQNENESDNEYRVPVCRFLLEKLIEWRYKKLFWEEYKQGSKNAIASLEKIRFPQFNFNIVQPLNEKNIFIQKILALFKAKDAEIERANLEIQLFNNAISEYKEKMKVLNEILPKLRLHADSTFETIIPEDIKEKNVIFVSDDNICTKNVGEKFDNANYETKRFNGDNKIFYAKDLNSGFCYNLNYKSHFNEKFLGITDNTI